MNPSTETIQEATDSPPSLEFPQSQLFLEKIIRIRDALGVKPSTSIILLLRYEWNEEALLSDYNAMKNLIPTLNLCVPEEPTRTVNNAVCMCGTYGSCVEINCGHLFCHDCLTGSISQQFERGRLMLVCPLDTCDKFFNSSNLPVNMMTNYVRSLLVDYTKKTTDQRSPLSKFVSSTWEHRTKIITTLVTVTPMVILAFYAVKARAWERAHPYKAGFLRLGFSVGKKTVRVFQNLKK